MQMTKKQIQQAAKDHSKLQLGEEQFQNNKMAAKAIAADFEAGADYARNNADPIKPGNEKLSGIDRVNKVCKSVLGLAESDITEVEEMTKRQCQYINPLKPNKQGKFNDLGKHNMKVIAALKNLQKVIAAGDPNR